MDANDIAAKLHGFGVERAEQHRIARRAMRRLRQIDRDECAYLQQLARMPMPSGVKPLMEDTIALVVAPKDDEE